jgi:hypothetical protein
MGRSGAPREDLLAELLAYLTLGALVQQDDEPLLRPKLHYFVQGYQGLGCSLDSQGEAKVHFDAEAGHDEEGAQVFPLVLGRSCGQHYFPLIAEEPVQRNGVGVRRTRTDTPVERGDEDEPLSRVYVTPTASSGWTRRTPRPSRPPTPGCAGSAGRSRTRRPACTWTPRASSASCA